MGEFGVGGFYGDRGTSDFHDTVGCCVADNVLPNGKGSRCRGSVLFSAEGGAAQ